MQTELSQFTAIIGIDWADKKHDVCVQDMATGRRRTSQVRHRAEDLDDWARSLHRRYGGPIAVALELSKGPIVSVLQKYDFFVLFPIDPSTLVEQRRKLMHNRVRITNRLRNALKQYYPQEVEWFDHIDTSLFCDFVRH